MCVLQSYSLVVLTTGALALASCEKDPSATGATPLPGSSPTTNTAPGAYAGRDIWVVLPDDTCTLSGLVSDEEYNIAHHAWRKASGPAAYRIENPDALQTKVSGLEEGTYEFELRVTDSKGLSRGDTVTVFVRQPATPGHGEAVFHDLAWECPMGCHVSIGCFPCSIPAGQPFKVYLRSSDAGPWVEVVPEALWTAGIKYSYSIYNNNLAIYTLDEEVANDRADVRITF